MKTSKRTAIYFAYEGRHNNPNGDPASENKPRVYNQSNVYVTDVASKRDDRDYLNQICPGAVFLKRQLKDDGTTKQMGDLIKDALSQVEKLDHAAKARFFINRFIDIKYFGATLTGTNKTKDTGNKKKKGATDNNDTPAKSDDKETIKESICGPIQKTFGISLNHPEIVPVKITTVLATREGSTATGSMGTKYVCDYYHIHYDIVLNPFALDEWSCVLTDEDIAVFESTQWVSIKNDISHSKINREPILMLEIVFKDPDYYFIPSNYVGADNVKGKSFDEIKVDYSRLVNQINSNKQHIEKVRYIVNPVFMKQIKEKLLDAIEVENIEIIEILGRDEIKAHLEKYQSYNK